MKTLWGSLFLLLMLNVSACQQYLDPNASIDGIVGTVSEAFGNLKLRK